MTYAARHPDLFAAAASLSGFLDSDFLPASLLVTATPLADGGGPDAIYGPRSTQEIRWRGHNPKELAANLRDVDLQVRTAEGIPGVDELPATGAGFDCVVEAGVAQTTHAFHDRLAALGIPHVFKDYATGCHTVPNFQREFADALPGIERVLAHPQPDPATFTYRSIEPRFTVWGWQVDADPARALEFLGLTDAGRDDATLTGSGTTTVTTPPFFAGLRAVDVVQDGVRRTLAPGADGRLRLAVGLGPAHPHQQDTAAARAAGDGTAGYFTSRRVVFEPHARLRLSRVRIRATGARVCARAIGTTVGRVRLSLADARNHRVGRSRRVAVGTGAARCARLTAPARLRPGRYRIAARATDRFGHRVTAHSRPRSVG
jgi:hypothetical protein